MNHQEAQQVADAVAELAVSQMEAVAKAGRSSGPLSVFPYCGMNVITGLGVMHAEQGVPLGLCLDLCVQNSYTPCLRTTRHELERSGVKDGEAVVRREVREMLEPVPEAWKRLNK